MTARRIVVTGQGSTTAAYAGIDWLALVATSIIWGASFLLIAEGLESLDPRVIAWTRLVLGAGVLVLFRRARRRIEPEDRVRIVVVGIASNVGVEWTMRDGLSREFFCVLLEDATMPAGPAYLQEATVFNVETFIGWVSTTGEFANAFGRAATA